MHCPRHSWPISEIFSDFMMSTKNMVRHHISHSSIWKYMVMSQDQNTGRSHSMKTDNSSIERVEEFKYLGTTLTTQNSIQEEIKSRLKLGNACYYSVQNLLCSNLLSKNLKIKIYNFVRCPVWV